MLPRLSDRQNNKTVKKLQALALQLFYRKMVKASPLFLTVNESFILNKKTHPFKQTPYLKGCAFLFHGLLPSPSMYLRPGRFGFS